VADLSNGRLRKIVGRQVTTLAGGSEAGTAGAGAERASASPASWTSVDACSWRNSQRRARCGWLAPPAWIGPMDPAAEAAAEAQEGKALETAQTHTHTCGGGAGGKSSGNRARARARARAPPHNPTPKNTQKEAPETTTHLKAHSGRRLSSSVYPPPHMHVSSSACMLLSFGRRLSSSTLRRHELWLQGRRDVETWKAFDSVRERERAV